LIRSDVGTGWIIARAAANRHADSLTVAEFPVSGWVHLVARNFNAQVFTFQSLAST